MSRLSYYLGIFLGALLVYYVGLAFLNWLTNFKTAIGVLV